MNIRSFWKVVEVDKIQSPYNVIQCRIIYPALVKEKKLGGLEPPDPKLAPYPIVIFFNGAFCTSSMYLSLLINIVKSGFVAILYDWVSTIPPENVGPTPGIDTRIWMPDAYGTAPSALALPSILKELKYLNSSGILAGTLDLQKIVLGGHSAGGKLALENTNPNFFPQVVASFSYGCDSAAFTQLGYKPGTILNLPSFLPTLLIGGTRDGVVQYMSQKLCGIDSENKTTSLVKTFNEGISGNRNDSYLVILEGANHFSIADFTDPTTHAANLDFLPTQPQENYRALITEIVCNFVNGYVRKNKEALEFFAGIIDINNPLIAQIAQK